MKNTPTQMEIVASGGGAIESHRQQPGIAEMLQAVLERGVTQENVAAIGELVKLYERMEDKKSEKEFSLAFNALQSEMPKIQARQAVPNNDGSIRYTFAPYEAIMEQVQPMLLKHGFTVTFSTRYEESRLVKICTLQHTSGHKQANEFAVRIGKGPPFSSETQGDGAAATYAKRFALCDALNITIEKDTDARNEGAAITSAQADEFERRVAETNSDRAAFLKYAGANSFREIGEAKYSLLDELLAKKERTGR